MTTLTTTRPTPTLPPRTTTTPSMWGADDARIHAREDAARNDLDPRLADTEFAAAMARAMAAE